jgi:hypothetical protein
MIHLLVSYFRSQHNARRDEYRYALESNIKLFDKVHIFAEDKLDLNHKNVKIIPSEWMTFNKFFEYANTLNGYVVISNLDIAFDNSIHLLKKIVNEDTCIALTRWDFNKSKRKWNIYNRSDSQDTWIFKTPIKKIKADFHIGQRGCDNVLANKLKKKYTIKNPAGVIVTRHIHKSGYRNYKLPVLQGGKSHVPINKKKRLT